MVCLVRGRVQVQREPEGPDRLFVRKSFRICPKEQPAGKVALGEVWVEIERFFDGYIGIFMQQLSL